jgi:gliding motility-associated protein GldE
LNVSTAAESAGVVAGFVAIVVLLAGSALMSASEVAYFSLGPNHLHELRNGSHRADRAVLQLLEMPKRLLATILISNNFINVAIVVISTYLVNSLINFQEVAYWMAFLVQVVTVTALILLLGEIMPKVYATRRNLRFARMMAGPIRVLMTILYPLSILLVKSTSLIDKRISRKSYNISISELSDAIELTTSSDTPEGDKKILQGIAKLSDIEVKEIMRSRMDVTAVEISTGFRKLLKIIIEAGYSRIPVFEDSFDNVRGILYIKDLLPHTGEGDEFDWKMLLRDALFIPENKKINDLLQEFQEKKVHMAVIVDEYGGTSGIVTLEDIIEEIVGEISDEHDEPVGDFMYTRLDERNFIFEGKISLNDIVKILGLEDDIFDDARGDADSLAGLLLELFQKMPERDEQVSFRNFTFTVKAVDKRRIKRVLVNISPEEE